MSRIFYIDKLVLFCGFTEKIDLPENKWICRNNLIFVSREFWYLVWWTKLVIHKIIKKKSRITFFAFRDIQFNNSISTLQTFNILSHKHFHHLRFQFVWISKSNGFIPSNLQAVVAVDNFFLKSDCIFEPSTLALSAPLWPPM